MSFGEYTNINIAPQVGYSWNKYFTLGGGISYNYYEDTRYDQKINYAGLHIYGRAYPIDYLTVYVQPELHRRWGSIRGYPSEDNVFACLLLGAGAVIPMPKGNVTITFYYDVLQNRYTPHGNKIGYSVGYNFRF